MCLKVKQYAKEIIVEISIELMWEYFHDTILLKLVKEKFKASKYNNSYGEHFKTLLNEYGLAKLCPITISLDGETWICYKEQMKGFYVDGHERPATIIYCNQFVARYLRYEQRIFQWIQIIYVRRIGLQNKKMIPSNSGYEYLDDNGVIMIEYHVNSCLLFQDELNKIQFLVEN